MCVLLGLGEVDLPPAGLGEGLRQRPGFLGREGDLDGKAGLVLGHRDDLDVRRRGAAVWRGPVEVGEVRVGQGVDQLAGAIGPEVGVDEAVAVAHPAVDAIDDRRRDELVALTAPVGGADRLDGARGLLPHPVDDRVIAALDPVPPAVAVHGPVPAPDRGDAGVRVGRSQPRLEVRDEVETRRRRRVAPVEQRVDPHTRHGQAGRQRDEGDEVAVVGMDATRPDEADDVQAAVHPRLSGAGRDERRPRRERPVGDRRVDPRQILEDRPPGAEVQVADLGVAHLTGRQADCVLGCAQCRVRPLAEERTPGRQRGRRDGIGRGICADSEPVEDDEDDRTRPGRGCGHIERGRGDGGGRRADGDLLRRETRRSIGHATPSRAAAVRPARATIPAISSGLSEAPPTSAPSMVGSAKNSPMFAEVTLPPYRTGTASAEFLPADPCEDTPDRDGHRGGVGAARIPAGPDRPDRLVGDHESRRGHRHRVVVGERASELAVDHLVLVPRLAVGQDLTDTQDRAQACVHGAAELAPDQLVGFARVTAALGVADDHPCGEPGQHGSRRLAGVRALELVVDRLGADRDGRVDLA